MQETHVMRIGEMGVTCSKHGIIHNKLFLGKRQVIRPHDGPRYRCQDIIKTDIRGVGGK
jgi:hypothetical protein